MSKTDNQESYYIKQIVSKYGRDEAISALNRKLKQVEFDLGVKKSECAELQHSVTKLKKRLAESKSNPKGTKEEVIMLKQKVRNLEHQLIANNIPIPKEYQKPINTTSPQDIPMRNNNAIG